MLVFSIVMISWWKWVDSDDILMGLLLVLCSSVLFGVLMVW